MTHTKNAVRSISVIDENMKKVAIKISEDWAKRHENLEEANKRRA